MVNYGARIRDEVREARSFQDRKKSDAVIESQMSCIFAALDMLTKMVEERITLQDMEQAIKDFRKRAGDVAGR